MTLLVSILFAYAIPKYAVTNLNVDSGAVYRVDASHVAVDCIDGLRIYDDEGNLKETKKLETKDGDLLGYSSMKERLLGPEYAWFAQEVTNLDGSVSNNKFVWRTFFDRGIFLHTDGRWLVAALGINLVSIDNVGWYAMYCTSQDSKAVYVIQAVPPKGDGPYPDDLRASLQKISHLQYSEKVRRSKPKLLKTTGGKNLRVIVNYTASLTALTKTKLLAFCNFDGFSAKELEATPAISVGPPNEIIKPSFGICEIDTDTGICHVLARIKDTYPMFEAKEQNSPMERRQDLAAFDSNGSFIATFENNTLFFHAQR